MKRALAIGFMVAMALGNIRAQCPDHVMVRNLRFDQIAFLYTHNSYNVRGQHRLANQGTNVAAQLAAGVRGLMLDVYARRGKLVLYHGTAALGSRPLAEDLETIRAFLAADSCAVMSIIFENHVPPSAILRAMHAAGLGPYLHLQQRNQAWPLLPDMRASNRRLVVFVENMQDESADTLPGIHHAWEFMTENHYSNHSRSDFSLRHNRGDSTHTLYLMNNFITHRKFGYGLPDSAEVANSQAFILGRGLQLLHERQRLPNFIAVDFVEVGGARAAVDSLNTIALREAVARNRSVFAFQNQTPAQAESIIQFWASVRVGQPEVLIKDATWNAEDETLKIHWHRKPGERFKLTVVSRDRGEPIWERALFAEENTTLIRWNLESGNYELTLQMNMHSEKYRFTVE